MTRDDVAAPTAQKNHENSAGMTPGEILDSYDAMLRRQMRTVEIQLRTSNQQRWAEVVSQTEDRLEVPLRDGDGPAELVEYFRAASHLLASQDGEFELDDDFADRFNDLREQAQPYFTEN